MLLTARPKNIKYHVEAADIRCESCSKDVESGRLPFSDILPVPVILRRVSTFGRPCFHIARSGRRERCFLASRITNLCARAQEDRLEWVGSARRWCSFRRTKTDKGVGYDYPLRLNNRQRSFSPAESLNGTIQTRALRVFVPWSPLERCRIHSGL